MNTKLFSLFAVGVLLLGAVSCSSDGVTEEAPNGIQGIANTTDKLTTFTASVENPVTRTSLNYNTGKFFWEAGDKIWVQDDNGIWQQSDAVTGSNVTKFKFSVPGSYTGTSYKVVYHGDSKADTQVEIAATQIQEIPNTTTHFGTAGDFGIATATGNPLATPEPAYGFLLDHKAAYLVFQPYTNNIALQTNCYLIKIEVTSDNDIAGTYTLNPTTGQLAGGSGNQIILTTKGASGSATEKGFTLNTTSASVATNGAYMVIKPGTHKLKVRYWVKDYTTGTEGAITKNYPVNTYDANNYYDLTANLKLAAYPYYAWDSNDPVTAASLGHVSSESYPNFHYNLPLFNPASTSHVPGVNEMSWYVMKGDPRWDSDRLWTSNGHLYKGGMWFKKMSRIKIDAVSEIAAAGGDVEAKGIMWDGSYGDGRTNPSFMSNNVSITSGIPSESQLANYFFLPAMGFYNWGNLTDLGTIGYYWSSTPQTSNAYYSYMMYFSNNSVGVTSYNRGNGMIAIPFEQPL